MSKKVSIGAKPTARPATADAWVENRARDTTPPRDAMKRLTFDIPDALHRRIKATCATRGVKMADELRRMLEQHFPEK